MTATTLPLRRMCVLATALGACNAQFDFDTEPLDASGHEAARGADDAGDASGGSGESDATLLPGRIACGTSTCVLPSRTCCVANGFFSCVETKEVTCPGVSIRCDSSSDCAPGNVCCATVANMLVMSVQCQDPVTCTSPGQVVLCDPGEPGVCASCVPSSAPLPAGYHECG